MDNASKSAVIGMILNVVLPMVLQPFASLDEIKPPSGAGMLSYKGQFMHMMVHHNQVILVSSLIVGLIVFLSVYLRKYVNQFIYNEKL